MQRRMVLGGNQPTFGGGRLCPRSYRAGVRFSSQDQVETAEHHGLSGAGLPADDGQPRGGFDSGGGDHAQVGDRQFFDHGCCPVPRHPCTGKLNLSTRRAVNGAVLNRARRTGSLPRTTSICAPGGATIRRCPSHQMTAGVSERVRISTDILEFGPTTRGRANSACALTGTISIASTSGHTTGPPAEKAYAVEPVGVASTTPSHPNVDSARPSMPSATSIIRSRWSFSTETSLIAHPVSVEPSGCWMVTSRVMRSSTV